jgi:signal transduction histidine kinase
MSGDLNDLNLDLEYRVRQEIAESRKKDLLLQQQAKMAALGEMLGNIAHQWRQPLNSLAIILMNLEDSFAHGEANADSVSKAVRRANELLANMSRTIDDFRHFFRNDKLLTDGKLEEVVAECVELLEATLGFHRIKLTIHVINHNVLARIQAAELLQALLCLINNAKEQIIQNNIDSGEITLEIDRDADWAIIRIIDNGGGIPEVDLPKLFDPYFTTKPNGIGLGLYITQLTIEQSMKGRIEVKNLVQGAQFNLFLPLIHDREQIS